MLQLVRLSLAIISLTDLLAYQKIFQPIREYFGWKHDQDGIASEWVSTNSKWRDFYGEVLGCFRCTSVWTALLLTIISFLPFSKILENILIGSWVATTLNRISGRYF